MKFYAQIINGKLVPEHDSDRDNMAKIRSGVTYRFDVVKERNYEFHKKYMALLNLAYMNQETFNNFDSMRKWLQMKAGFFIETITPTGTMYESESISFASKDEIQFQGVYSRVMDEVCKWLDLSNEDIQNEIINFI